MRIGRTSCRGKQLWREWKVIKMLIVDTKCMNEEKIKKQVKTMGLEEETQRKKYEVEEKVNKEREGE